MATLELRPGGGGISANPTPTTAYEVPSRGLFADRLGR